MKGITLTEVQMNQKFQELMGILHQQGGEPKLFGGLIRNGWTNHDIDISVSKSVVVPLDLLLLRFGRRWFPVSLKIQSSEVE
jgi:hypothetical protein